MILRIGFWVILYLTHNKEPPKSAWVIMTTRTSKQGPTKLHGRDRKPLQPPWGDVCELIHPRDLEAYVTSLSRIPLKGIRAHI